MVQTTRRVATERPKTPKKFRAFLLLVGGIAAILGLVLLVFGNVLVNSVVKRKVQVAFSNAHPGTSLKLGELRYSIFANRLAVSSASLNRSNLTFVVEAISVSDVNWWRLAFRKPRMQDIFSRAKLDAAGLKLEFPEAQYGLRCGKLRVSATKGEVFAEDFLLKPTVDVEDLFAARQFRTTHVTLGIKAVRISQIAVRDALELKSLRAGELRLTGLNFEALVNRDKPKKPVEKPPPMAHEALATIPLPIEVSEFHIEDSRVAYRERKVAREAPGELLFTRINMMARDVSNFGDPPPTIIVQAQGDLMDTATMKIELAIPTRPSSFSLSYSGSLSAMDLRRLNAFLEVPEKLRIKSGYAEGAEFRIQIEGGEARGIVRAKYHDLQIAVLNDATGEEAGFKTRLKTSLLNAVKVRDDSSAEGKAPAASLGHVEYQRDKDDKFIQVLWFALRTGVLDAISH